MYVLISTISIAHNELGCTLIFPKYTQSDGQQIHYVYHNLWIFAPAQADCYSPGIFFPVETFVPRGVSCPRYFYAPATLGNDTRPHSCKSYQKRDVALLNRLRLHETDMSILHPEIYKEMMKVVLVS